MTAEEKLEEFRKAYAIERQVSDIKTETLPFDHQEYQWWDWYYFIQWNWRSMTRAEAKLVYPEIREKPRKH